MEAKQILEAKQKLEAIYLTKSKNLNREIKIDRLLTNEEITNFNKNNIPIIKDVDSYKINIPFNFKFRIEYTLFGIALINTNETYNISKEEIEMVMPNPLMKKYIININPNSDIIIEVLYGVSSHDYIIFFPKL